MSSEKSTLQEQQTYIEKIDSQNNEFLSFNESRLKKLIKNTWDLLEIDNYEKKEILKKLWDEAPDFLAEIKTVENEFKWLMLNYNSENKHLICWKTKRKDEVIFWKIISFQRNKLSFIRKNR